MTDKQERVSGAVEVRSERKPPIEPTYFAIHKRHYSNSKQEPLKDP